MRNRRGSSKISYTDRIVGMAYYRCEVCDRHVRCPETQVGSVQQCPVCEQPARVMAGDIPDPVWPKPKPTQPAPADSDRAERIKRAGDLMADTAADAIRFAVIGLFAFATAAAGVMFPPFGIWVLFFLCLYGTIRLAISHSRPR